MIKLPMFTFERTPEQNLQLYQKALNECEIPKDRITLNQMYGNYVKTLPHHQRLLKMQEDKEKQHSESTGETPKIEFAVVE